MTIRLLPLLALFTFPVIPEIRAERIHFQSGGTRVKLIELFTSQGCSSCPAAEKWLNDLVDDSRLWDKIVPVAFHVDYWDRLGWKDPYARKAYTKAQYAYRSADRLKTVYTPCFMVNGNEWRGWFSDPRRIPESSAKAGVLSAISEDGALEVSYSNFQQNQTLHVVLLGFGETTAVRRGENAGRRLESRFVALHRDEVSATNGIWRYTLPEIETEGEDARQAVAIWVTGKDSLQPLQATGSWLK